jgi:osmotically-inducible protein OsmY
MFNFFGKTDSQIQTDVTNELKWDPSVTDTQINVTAKDGVVTLRGSVPHFFDKSTAEEAAQRVGGVRAIADEIEVDIMGSYERSDGDIAEAALSALKWNYAAPKDLKVVVEKGWITLKGEADWDFERTAAKNSVRTLMGVRGVSNNITLKTMVLQSDVKTHIEEALKRSAEAEGRKIHVSVERDQVTLTGNVHSFAEIADAGLAAWNAPGVKRVENNLKIAQ